MLLRRRGSAGGPTCAAVLAGRAAVPRAATVSALSGAVLVVGDVVEPGDDLSLRVGLVECEVRHEAFGGGAVPVLFVWRDEHDISGPDLLHLAAAGGDVADAVGDVQRLTLWMGV